MPRPTLLPHTLPPLAAMLIALTLILGAAAPPRAGAVPALAAQRELSTITATGGTVTRAELAGDRVVYLADYDARGVVDLYSVPLAGGTPARLSAGLPSGEVEEFRVAGDRVVFSHRVFDGNRLGLYSAPLGGGQPTRLNPAYPPGSQGGIGFVELRFKLTPDLATVVFTVDQNRGGQLELFRVPVAGGEAVRLNGPLPYVNAINFSFVEVFQLSANGQLAVFLVRSGTSGGVDGLFAVNLVGDPAPIQLTTTPMDAEYFQTTPDGGRVVFYNEDDLGEETLRSITTAGTGLVTLAEVSNRRFALTPDGQSVLYYTENPAFGENLVREPIAGGAPLTLATEVNPWAGPISFDPAGASVFLDRDTSDGLWRSRLSDGNLVQVSGLGDIDFAQLRFTGDEQYAVVRQNSGGFFSVALADNSVTPLTGAFAEVAEFPLTAPAGATVIFTARAAAQDPFAVYAVSAQGGAPRRLNGPLATDEVGAVALAVGDSVIYATEDEPVPNHSSGRRSRLFAVPLDGLTAPTRLDQSRAIVGGVRFFRVSPIDNRVVYSADELRGGEYAVHSITAEGTGKVTLSPPFAPGESASAIRPSPAGGRVVYAAQHAGDTAEHLWSVPIAGGAAPVRLSPDLADGNTIRNPVFSADGSTVFFLAGPEPYTLYRVPAAGGVAVPLASDVMGFRLTPDETRIVIERGFNSVFASIPAAGGAETALGAGSWNYELSADSTRIVFFRDSPAALVAVDLASGDAQLLFDLAGVGSLYNSDFDLTPDGSHVVFSITTGSGSGDTPFERTTLRRVPLAGGTAVTIFEQVGADLNFTLPPAGGRVVFDLETVTGPGTRAHTINSVPLIGGEPTTLFGPVADDLFVVGEDAPDGSAVLFRYQDDLYAVRPTAPSARKLNPSGSIDLRLILPDNRILLTLDDEGGLYLNGLLGGDPTLINAPLPESTFDELRVIGQTAVYELEVGSRNYITRLFAADIPPASEPPLPPATRYRALLPLIQR